MKNNKLVKYIMVVIVACLIVLILYFIFYKNNKCTKSSDCKNNLVCINNICQTPPTPPIIPPPIITPHTLTSNTSDPNFLISRSSYYTDESDVSYDAWRCFDGGKDINTYWLSRVDTYLSDGSGNPTNLDSFNPTTGLSDGSTNYGSWIKVSLNEVKIVSAMRIARGLSMLSPIQWVLYGSQTGDNYTVIYNQSTDYDWTGLEAGTLSNPISFTPVQVQYIVIHIKKKTKVKLDGATFCCIQQLSYE